MAKSGKGKKSSKEVKNLKGTRKKSRDPKPTMEVEPVKKVENPTNLINDFAEKEWEAKTKELNAAGDLFTVDLTMLIVYCNYVGIYCDCQERLKETGFNQESTSTYKPGYPEEKRMNDAAEKMIKLAKEFGFTPLARTKLPKVKDDKPIDPMEGF